MTITASLTLEQAAAKCWPVVIVGGGPAGAWLARALALANVNVLLVERGHYPRPKVCGCCLGPTGLQVLAEGGLGSLAADLGAQPTTSVRLLAGSRQADLPLSAGGVSLSREALDLALVRAAQQAGAELLLETEAVLERKPTTNEPSDAGREFVRLRQGMQETVIEAHFVVAADGLRAASLRDRPEFASRVQPASLIGAGITLPPQDVTDLQSLVPPETITMLTGPSGYLGLAWLEDGRLDAAAALQPAAVKSAAGVGQAVAALVESAGVAELAGRMAAATWRGTPRLTHRRSVAAGRVFLVGDAAAYVEPFTGEGMSWALLGSTALAPLLVAAASHPLARPEPWAQQWSERHRQVLGVRLQRCGWVARLLRQGWLLPTAVGMLAHWPGAAAPWVRAITRPPPVKSMVWS